MTLGGFFRPVRQLVFPVCRQAITDIREQFLLIYYLIFFTGKKVRVNVTAEGTVGEIKRLKNEKLEQSKLKQMNMIIYMTLCTVIFHFIQFIIDVIIVVVAPTNTTNIQLLLVGQVVLMLEVALKPVLIFLFFFYFNSKFRDAFRKLLLARC
jgi:hypothetical protein